MGIRHLNKYLKEKCTSQSIRKIHLKKLSGKTLVIDTSIYMYHFLAEYALMENMYLFISILKTHNITPIFIFDGKTPLEKKDVLIERAQRKKEAEEKYNTLLEESKKEMNEQEQKKMSLELEALKRQFVRLRGEDIVKVKSLMDAYGVIYYDAPNEADDLCAYFVKSGMAHGCISDDMDMFLYGCPIVLRNINLISHSVSIYETENILEELEMPMDHFRQIMVLSGTDYNVDMGTSLNETMKWYKQYTLYIKKSKEKNKPYYGFYLWLAKNTKYIKDLSLLFKTYQIFNNDNPIEYQNTSYCKETRPENQEEVKQIMQQEGFMFC
jgi:5'-3' exonuclease